MSNVFDKFPHNQYRKYQKYLVSKLNKAVRSDQVDFVILEAPTGLGKTAVAGTVAANNPQAFYLTEQKIHQDQMVEEFPQYTQTVKGQRNYCCGEEREDCLDPIPGKTCFRKPTTEYDGAFAGESNSRGTLRWRPGLAEPCPYFKAKTRGMDADIACLNYSYFLAETHYSGDFGHRNVMIADEAHNVGETLKGFLSFRVGEEGDFSLVDEVGLDLVDLGPEISHWESWITGSLRPAVEGRFEEVRKEVEADWEENDREEVDYELLHKKDLLDEIACSIRRFDSQYDERYFDDMDWAVERTYEDDKLSHVEFTPVSAAPFTERFIWDYADTVILMSATILDVDILTRSLGLKQYEDRIFSLSIPSPFPASSRPIEYFDAPSVNHDNWSEAFPHTCRLIDAVAQKDGHLDEKGIIHTVSYKNEDMILQNVSRPTRRRLMHHGPESGREREDVLEEFKQSDGNEILMSPAMFEGTDLKYDMSRFQIIPKVPFLSLGSKAIQKKQEQDPQWYDWRTAIRMIQSFGRSVRAEDDYAKTYILDGAFQDFYRRCHGLFPDYIKGTDEVEGSLTHTNVKELLNETNAVV